MGAVVNVETGVEVYFPYDRLPKYLLEMDGQPRPLPKGEGPNGALTEEQVAWSVFVLWFPSSARNNLKKIRNAHRFLAF